MKWKIFCGNVKIYIIHNEVFIQLRCMNIQKWWKIAIKLEEVKTST